MKNGLLEFTGTADEILDEIDSYFVRLDNKEKIYSTLDISLNSNGSRIISIDSFGVNLEDDEHIGYDMLDKKDLISVINIINDYITGSLLDDFSEEDLDRDDLLDRIEQNHLYDEEDYYYPEDDE